MKNKRAAMVVDLVLFVARLNPSLPSPRRDSFAYL
jgi:hypothetical protein